MTSSESGGIITTMQKVYFKDKKRVTIFLTEEKEKELKKKAIDAGVSLSTLLSTAGTISSVREVQNNQNTGGVPVQ